MNSKCVRVGSVIPVNCYIVSDDGAKEPFLAVIDPGDDPDFIASQLPGTPTHIIITHCHFDHIGALAPLHDRYPSARIAVGESEDRDPERILSDIKSVLGSFFKYTAYAKNGCAFPEPDILLRDGDEIGPFRVLFTPGHTKGSICLYSEKDKVLYSGDTLFRHSYGRTDLPGGSDEQMAHSLKRLLHLDPDITVYPGHDESTLIGDEQLYFNF